MDKKYICIIGFAFLLILGLVYMNLPCASPKGMRGSDDVMAVLLHAAANDSSDELCEVIEKPSSNQQVLQSLRSVDELARDSGGYEQLKYGTPEREARGYTYTLTGMDTNKTATVTVYSSHRPWYKQWFQFPLFESDAFFLTIPIELTQGPIDN